jgi:hypothetical protein
VFVWDTILGGEYAVGQVIYSLNCFFSRLIFLTTITARYSNDLHELLEKLLLLSEVATLSYAPKIGNTELNVSIDVVSHQSTDHASQNDKNAFDSSHNFQKLLEEWDEPVQSAASESVRSKYCGDAIVTYFSSCNASSYFSCRQNVSSLKDILEFRQTVHLMQTDFPFSRLFGRADSREACATSSAKIYDRLVDSQLGNANLQFSTLAKVTKTTNSDRAQREKLMRLIKLFRPNKDKELTLIDFTRVRENFL